jgi:uncharacterized protein involved in exopolysaccharide biosynthesis
MDRQEGSSSEQLIYVVPRRAIVGSGDEIDLRQVWKILWQGRLVVIGVTAVIALAAVAYALLATEWYRSEVLLAPAEDKSAPSLSGELGGLAALAGVGLGGSDDTEALAVLSSRELARDFIDDFGLLPILFADDWDTVGKRWRESDVEEWPDVRAGVEYFHDEVLGVTSDRQTGLVTLSVEWTDPKVAAKWAGELVRRVNERMRTRALREAEANVKYLQGELAQTNVVSLQQSIGRLLESELQKLMLARGNEEFAFRVIDAAEAPKDPAWPNVALFAVVGIAAGAIAGVFGVLLAHALRSNANRIA